MTNEEFKQAQLNYYNNQADELVDNAISTLQRAIQELESYKRWNEKDKQLSATIHYLTSNVLGNTRMDIMASCMANIVINKN
jgi:hypothetical protein